MIGGLRAAGKQLAYDVPEDSRPNFREIEQEQDPAVRCSDACFVGLEMVGAAKVIQGGKVSVRRAIKNN